MSPFLIALFFILGGLVALYFGAEWLVRGSSSLALRLGLTPLMIGLTVVACGTSMPEFVVSLRAAFGGSGDIAVGNAVGSNIFNIAVILGIAAVISPMRVQLQIIRFDAPVVIGSALLFVVFFRDHAVSRLEGCILLAGLIVYLVLNVRAARRQPLTPELEAEFAEVVPARPRALWIDLLFVFAGLGTLVIGSHLLVKGAIEVARTFGVADAIIGLTIVAAGTSMPELATSVVAAIKKESDIALGNIVGSNVFNALGILGVGGSIRPLIAPGVQMLDVWVMTGFSLLLLPLVATGKVIGRAEGALLLGGYGAYLWYLWPK